MTSPLIERTVGRVRRIIRPWTQRRHDHQEGHRGEGSTIREVVFGANDGLVSNVALVAGVAGGTNDPRIIVLSGVAGLVAGAISMALGAYVSTKSEREFRDSEEARELWEVENMRELELAETRRIFRLKGITGPLLDEVVEVVSRDQEQWVKLMMTEELGFPDQPPRPALSAIVMGVAFGLAAFFPVAPYIFLSGTGALITAIGLTGLALFAVGGWRASLSNGNVLRKGAEMVFLAGAAVAAAHFIGTLIGVVI